MIWVGEGSLKFGTGKNAVYIGPMTEIPEELAEELKKDRKNYRNLREDGKVVDSIQPNKIEVPKKKKKEK